MGIDWDQFIRAGFFSIAVQSNNPATQIAAYYEAFNYNSKPGKPYVDNDGTNDIFDNKDEIKPSPPATPLFLGKMFYKGRTNLLYSDGKVGKSLLSIEIAKHVEIKKPFFILMEDYNNQQAYRYIHIPELSKKVEIMSRRTWNQFNEKVEKGQILKKQSKQMLKKLGLNDLNDQDNVEVLTNIIVFQKVMQIAISQGVDFICIDSLDALLSNTDTLKREVIEEILEIPTKNLVTVLLIHHENKQGKSAGTRHLKNSLDHIYHLEKTKQKDVLSLKEDSRYGESSTCRFKRISTDEYSVMYELVEEDFGDITDNLFIDNPSTLKEQVRAIIDSHTESNISFALLQKELKDKYQAEPKDKKSITNILTPLSENGIVKMGGKKQGRDTWDEIIILAVDKTKTTSTGSPIRIQKIPYTEIPELMEILKKTNKADANKTEEPIEEEDE